MNIKDKLGRCKCGNYYDGKCNLVPCELENKLDDLMIQASTEVLNQKIRRKYEQNREIMAGNIPATWIDSIVAIIKRQSTGI